MLKIGLTGNIAAGKTQVEKIISSLGFSVIDLDNVSHEILEYNKSVQDKILKEFKTLNRKELGNIIFKNPKKRKRLENIIHPILNKCIENFFIDNKNKNAAFVSGATIFEAGFDKTFDKIILIDAPKETKINRLMKRNNLTYKEALLRLETQENNRNKTKYIIDNDSDFETLEKKVKELLEKML